MTKINAVIAAAHGEFAKGIYSGIKLVAGPMDNLQIINFLEGDNYDTIDAAFEKAFEELKDYKNILVLTDLMGGTPFNRAVILSNERDDIRVLSGLNFALLYQALISEEEDIDLLCEEVLREGRDSIDYYRVKEKKEISDEDGI
ncbi:MAG: PTS fructose transporter subunit IIBC [Tissierellia bacterium]|nr:PTS fructose transporter subunit IIBC [Tissierellia bacterium]